MENQPYQKPKGLDETVGDKEYVAFLIDIWKKTIDVQMHFNQLSLQVRNFLITLFGGILTAFFLFVREGKVKDSIGFIFTALLVLIAMFIMDYFWYHKFLIASVRHAGKIEKQLKSILPNIDLGATIKYESTININNYWLQKFNKIFLGEASIGSKERLKIYYYLLFVSLLVPIIYINSFYKPLEVNPENIAPAQMDSIVLEKMRILDAKIDTLLQNQSDNLQTPKK